MMSYEQPVKGDENYDRKKALVADWQALLRTFIRPENQATRDTLIKYMEKILFGLHDFLQNHVGFTEEMSLKDLSARYMDTTISLNPEKKLADVITDLIEDIAPHAVNVASPYFIGHMTSAIPFFMVHLKTIVTALNQNVVKLETSKVVSVIEKQVLAKVHRLIYGRDEAFYREHVQNSKTTLGCFVDDGTLANLTALWVARNALFPPKEGFEGVEKEGVLSAYRAYGTEQAIILVSRLGHYSLRKSAGILGIGNQNIIGINVNEKNQIDLNEVRRIITDVERSQGRTRIMAIIGIAGATETGTIDPLPELGAICQENNIHFHVDAAWGGPTLLSKRYKGLLKGIELADSVTIDGHKQFYMPMTCGMVYFKDPCLMDVVVYHARYINRPGSVDLGIKSLQGSREATSLILDSAMKIMGTQGYALLLEHGIEIARHFAQEIKKRPLFQLVTEPVLNILTYRVLPRQLKQELETAEEAQLKEVYEKINEVNLTVQRLQREAGNSFVSRTSLFKDNSPDKEIVVLRCVIMSPLTNIDIVNEILNEQEKIYYEHYENK